jgi:hypothetical protein
MINRTMVIAAFICFLAFLSPSAESFEDDFNDGQFDGWTVAEGKWNVLDGEISGTGLLLLDEVRQADLKLQCRIRLAGCHSEAGIAIRYLDGNACVAGIGAQDDGVNNVGCGMIFGVMKGNACLPGGGTLHGIVARKWYTIRVSAHQRIIKLSVDELGKWTVEREYENRAGSVGLYSSGGVARFDDFVVMDWTAIAPGSRLATTWATMKKCQ